MTKLWWSLLPNLPFSSSKQESRQDACERDGRAATTERVTDDNTVSPLHVELAAQREECSKALQELNVLRHEHVELKKSLVEERTSQGNLSRQVAEEKQLRHEAQTKLVNLSNELERATVLLKREQEDKVDVMQDRDRYRDQINRRLLTQGTDIQATFPTTFEVRARIERVVVEAASDWLDVEEAAMDPMLPCISHHRLLIGLFIQCQALVQQHHQHYTEFFLGGTAAVEASVVRAMGQDTADFMRIHMRRHYTTLFPLTGAELNGACRKVEAMLRRWVAQNQDAPAARPQAASPSPHTFNVIKEYLHVLVAATLQNPPVVFSEDCGMEQPFDAKIHSQPIDGDCIGHGNTCVVIFPALLHEADDRSGLKPLTKRFILPVMGSS